jgi:hypothetical protein
MKKVVGPEGQEFEFPDDVTQEEIDSVVQRELGSQDAGGIPDPTFGGSGSVAALDPASAAQTEKGASMGRAIALEAPQTLGGVAGGLTAATGLTAGGPVLLPLAVGAGVGGAFGESMKQIGQHLSGSLDAPATSTEAAKRIGEAALTEAGFEMVGGLVAKGFGKILAPFRKETIPGLATASKRFEDQIKPVLLPSEATESRVLDILGNISESSLIGGNAIAKFKTKRGEFFDDFADSMIDQFGKRVSPDELGSLFVTALEAKRKVHKEAADVLYNNVQALIPPDEIVKRTEVKLVPTGIADEYGNPITRTVEEEVEEVIPGFRIPTRSLRDFSSKVRVHSTELGGIEAKNAGDDLMDAINGLPEGLSFQEAKELRSRLISRIDEFSVINKKAPAIGKAKKLVSLLDKQMADSLRGLKAPGVRAASGENKLYHGTNKTLKSGKDMDKGHRGYFLTEDPKVASKFGSNVYEASVDGLKTFDARDPEHLNRFLDEWNRKGYTYYRNPKMLAETGNHAFYEDWKVKATLEDLGYNANWQLEDKANTIRVFSRKSIKEFKKPTSDIPQQTPYEAWRIANRFYREGQEKYNNTLLRRLVKLADDTGTGAENIAPAIFKPGQVSKVRKVKRALGEGSDEWRNLKGFFIQHLLSKSTDVNGNLVGKRILNNMSGKPNSFGMPVLTEVFTGPQIRALEDFGRVLQATQASQGEGAGRMLIQLAQGTAVGRILLAGAIEPATATVILGPPLLSKMMLNPKTAKLLTEGISTPAGSEAAAGLLSRIVAASERVKESTRGEGE